MWPPSSLESYWRDEDKDLPSSSPSTPTPTQCCVALHGCLALPLCWLWYPLPIVIDRTECPSDLTSWQSSGRGWNLTHQFCATGKAWCVGTVLGTRRVCVCVVSVHISVHAFGDQMRCVLWNCSYKWLWAPGHGWWEPACAVAGEPSFWPILSRSCMSPVSLTVDTRVLFERHELSASYIAPDWPQSCSIFFFGPP